MKTRTVSVRVPVELAERLDKIAEKLDLSASDVAKHALRAAVQEIEALNYRIPWPPAFKLIQPSQDPSLVATLADCERYMPQSNDARARRAHNKP